MTHSAEGKQIRTIQSPKTSTSKSSLMMIFLITILLPISMEAAGLRLTPNRIYLLIFSVPFAVKVLNGTVGRITVVDVMFLSTGFWIMLALIVSHGVERIPFAGITVVELVGGYFVGRVLVRNIQDYNNIIRFLLVAMACLLPFALVESLTGRMLLPDLFRIAFDAPYRSASAYGRMGLERVYSVFNHPILFGLFCSIALANVFYLFSSRRLLAIFAAGFTLCMSFLSLSSAPLLACSMQIGLLTWNRVMKGKWLLLLALSTIMYIGIDLASNRTPITIIIDTLTFNSGTGWTRIAINKYGWASVWSHPIFGIGFNDWEKPSWLTSSVDNFWLVMGMRYGIVGLGLTIAAFLLHLICLGRVHISRNDVSRCRTAYGIVLVGICFTLITVHVWDTMSSFVMFYIGAGTWMYTSDTSDEPDIQSTPTKNSDRKSPYTRFPKGTHHATVTVSEKGL